MTAKAAHGAVMDMARVNFSGAVDVLHTFGGFYNLVPFVLAPLGMWLAPAGVSLLAGTAAAQVFAYYWMRVGSYHWYYAPALEAAILLAAIAIVRVGRGQPPRARWIPWALVALLLGSQLHATLTVVTGEDPNYIELGRYLHANAPADASVAAIEVGTIGWFSELRVVDPLGLATPAAGHILKGDFAWFLDERHPDYVVLHDPPWPGAETQIEKHPTFGREYRPLAAFGNPGLRRCILYRRQGASRGRDGFFSRALLKHRNVSRESTRPPLFLEDRLTDALGMPPEHDLSPFGPLWGLIFGRNQG